MRIGVASAVVVLVGGLVMTACGGSAAQTASRVGSAHPMPARSTPSATSGLAPAGTTSSSTVSPPAGALRSPGPLAFGSNGTLYIADPATNEVWARSPDGAFERIAGNGSAGFSGMGGPATAATLDQPEGLAKIGSVLYIADTGANRVVAVNQAGIINVVAGNGATSSHTSSGWTPGGGAALSTAIGPNVLGVAPGPQGSLLIATANEILELQGASLSVVLAGTSILGTDPHFPDASQCDPSGLAMGKGGSLYFVCANTYGLFQRHADGTVAYLGQFRSHGVALLSASPGGSVFGATGGVVSIAHGAVTVVETFPAKLANLGAFQAEYVTESSSGTFVADQSGSDGIGPPAIVAFTAGGAPTVLWPS